MVTVFVPGIRTACIRARRSGRGRVVELASNSSNITNIRNYSHRNMHSNSSNNHSNTHNNTPNNSSSNIHNGGRITNTNNSVASVPYTIPLAHPQPHSSTRP